MSADRTIRDALGDALWRLRHPSARLCAGCRLTWESRAMMAKQGGVCHDCYSDAISRRRKAGLR